MTGTASLSVQVRHFTTLSTEPPAMRKVRAKEDSRMINAGTTLAAYKYCWFRREESVKIHANY